MSSSEISQKNFIDNFCMLALASQRETENLRVNMFDLAQLLEKQVFTANSMFSNEEERMQEMWVFDIIQTHEKEIFLEKIKLQGKGFEKELESFLRQCKKLAEEFECPVCLTEMKPPTRIYQCQSGHPVCDYCFRWCTNQTSCPTCRMRMVGRSTLVEKLAYQFYSNLSYPIP